MLVVDGVEMLDVHEASRLAGRSAETIRRWVWSGRVTHVKLGNRLLIPRRDLAAVEKPMAVPESSLGSWLQQRSHLLGTPRRGTSAADLVLQDRAGRSKRDAGR